MAIVAETGGNGGDKYQKKFLHDCQKKGGFACITHGFHATLYAFRLYLNS